jgi:hypothetical protein
MSIDTLRVRTHAVPVRASCVSHMRPHIQCTSQLLFPPILSRKIRRQSLCTNRWAVDWRVQLDTGRYACDSGHSTRLPYLTCTIIATIHGINHVRLTTTPRSSRVCCAHILCIHSTVARVSPNTTPSTVSNVNTILHKLRSCARRGRTVK